MKKRIATALFFASFSIAFAQVRGFYGDITWVFYDRPGSSVGLCEVWHFTEGDPRYKKCSLTNTLTECQVATCDSQGGAPASPVVPVVQPIPPVVPIALTPSQLNRRTPQYLAGLRVLGRQIGAANTPVFRPSGSSAYVLTLKAELFGIVFRNCPADSALTDLKNDYIVVKISDGQPPYSITTPGFISEFRRVEGNASYWGIRVATPRYEATRMPLSIRDSVGQVVPLAVQTSPCPS